MRENSSVLLFVKMPGESNIKSRLAMTLGNDASVDIYKCFVADIIGTLKKSAYPVIAFYYPPDAGDAASKWLGDDLPRFLQRGVDIGDRMKNAFVSSFSWGLEKAVIIGSDIPDLTAEALDEAFLSLNDSDAVIGPASDGGYYLIGFRRETFLPGVFQKITWGGDSVFSQTMELFGKSGAKVYVLPEHSDVDTIEDLRALFIRNKDTAFDKSLTMSFIAEHKLF